MDYKREIRCSLVSSFDPLTRNLRTAVSQRYNNPPKHVNYKLRIDSLSYPQHLGHYRVTASSVLLSITKLLSEATFQVKEKQNSSLIHSFFWSIQRYDLPWIHENDQSLGQYFKEYLHSDSWLKRSAVAIASNTLNSRSCKGIVLWSEWSKRGYIEDGVEKDKIQVIPPAFVPTPTTPKLHDSLNVLFIGRDYRRKGGDTAFQVFDSLKKLFSNLRLVYVGRITDPKDLRRVRGDRSIEYHEYVSKNALEQNIFPAADLFLLPTRSEAYGMSIVEAMCKGIPIVSSKISAIPEIVEEGVSGHLCNPQDTTAYADACASILEDEERRKKMGNNALTCISKKFSPDVIGEKLYSLYSRVTN